MVVSVVGDVLSAGERVGQYAIVRHLASGGMGDVYLASDSDGRTVALKFFRQSEYFEAEDQRRRFQRERHLAAQLSHPHIVRLYDHGESAGQQFIAMEYAEGGSLRDVLDRSEKVSLPTTVTFIDAVAQALSYLHENGIVHRDLKADNVLLDKTGCVKVTDFGLASHLEDVGSLTTSGQILGSMDYLAPEQRHQLPTDERADQYSLAVLSYELLTGEKPQGVFKTPSEINSELNAAIDSVVMKALRKDPDERFRSVNEYAAALKDAARLNAQQQRNRRRRNITVCGLLALLFGMTAMPVIQSPPTIVDSSISPVDRSEISRLQTVWADALSMDVSQVNSLGMTLQLIPPGKFKMGASEEDIAADHAPHKKQPGVVQVQRVVEIPKPFLIGTHEVSVGQFRQFIEDSDYRTDAEQGIGESRPVSHRIDSAEVSTWDNPGYPITNEQPVVHITWNDASIFCNWLSDREGQTYRLPTETEWECACRAGTTTAWFFGDEFTDGENFAWFISRDDVFSPPAAVQSQRLPNAFGLYDMHGNVAEWTLDVFSGMSDPSAEDPARMLNSTSARRIVRGGHYLAHEWWSRSASRTVRRQYSHAFNVGFRILLELDEDGVAIVNSFAKSGTDHARNTRLSWTSDL